LFLPNFEEIATIGFSAFFKKHRDGSCRLEEKKREHSVIKPFQLLTVGVLVEDAS